MRVCRFCGRQGHLEHRCPELRRTVDRAEDAADEQGAGRGGDLGHGAQGVLGGVASARAGVVRVSIEGPVDELAEVLEGLNLRSKAPRGGAGAVLSLRGKAGAGEKRKSPRRRGPGRLPGAVPPRGVERCLGIGGNGERCRRWSSDSFPQCATILERGYCRDHLDQGN